METRKADFIGGMLLLALVAAGGIALLAHAHQKDKHAATRTHAQKLESLCMDSRFECSRDIGGRMVVYTAQGSIYAR